MEGIVFYKKPRLKNPILIAAWPGMGEVAFKAATFLIDKLKAEEFAEILPKDFFYLTGSVVQDGVLSLPELPYSKFYYWKNKGGKNDIIIFVSDAQPDLIKADAYCKKIITVAKTCRAEKIISFAAMPQAIDHAQQPAVWMTATSAKLVELLKKMNFQVLPEGQVSGLNGLFLGLAKGVGFEGMCILAEIPLYTIQIENPKASHAVLDAAIKILDLQIDIGELLEQSHGLDEQINKLLDFLKAGQTPAPIGEDEVEKIKKSLSQLTKLPVSIKEKIEKLFDEAHSDISRANQLKAELDKWNVYRDYEDRFLDLFKKKEQNN